MEIVDIDYDFEDNVSDSAEIFSWLANNSNRLIKQEFKLIAKFSRFSEIRTCVDIKHTSDFHAEMREDEIFVDGSYLPLILKTMNYKNGRSYVSIILRSLLLPHDVFVLSCVVSVIDSSDEERYSKTYLKCNIPGWRTRTKPLNFSSGEDMDFVQQNAPKNFWCCNIGNSLQNPTLHNFISLETLLRLSDELLPNDCLKLQIACNLQFLTRIPTQRLEKYLQIGTFARSTGPFIVDRNFLSLHSEAHQALCEATDYLKTVHIVHMLEYKKRYLRISETVIRAFSLICEIVKKSKVIKIKSFEDFHKMFILADYYNYASVCDACRTIQNCFLCCADRPIRYIYEQATEFNKSLFPECEIGVLYSLVVPDIVSPMPRGTEVTYIEINGLIYWCKISSVEPIVTLKLTKITELEFSNRGDFDFYH